MEKYAYPAIFTPEAEGYSIRFPGFESCYTSAPTLEEGLEMAADVLGLTLRMLEERGEQAPERVDGNEIHLADKEFVKMIECVL